MRLPFTLAIALLSIGTLAGQSSQNLDFLAGLPDAPEYRTMLKSYLGAKANRLLADRRTRIARFTGAQDVAERKRYVRERMVRALGGLPERTPLNARVVGTLERDDYRIEKIIFESQPRFYVTANLYLPKTGQPPYPAILFPLGHEEGAKAHFAWQHVLVSLARKGFVGLAWDTIGQGERVQLFDADFEDSKVFRSTTEHTIAGIQCLLTGDSLARYTVWDGMRALDYLLSRQEADPRRIGLTGNSGGGTHTAYLAALEDRIHVAAPSCYITSWERLLATIGPQDAEQCLPPWIADGLDHPDFFYAFAPRPFLMLSAIRDFFSISGARASFEEAKRVYTLLGEDSKLDMFEADDGHGYNKERRLASYRWFSHWLKGEDGEQQEPDVAIATPEELQCTPTGQVATSLGGETVQSLNRKRMEGFRRDAAPATADEVRRMAGFEKRGDPLRVRPYGVIRADGYRIEKLIFESEPGIRVPSLLYVPGAQASRLPAAVYVHGGGKAAGRGDLEQLAKAGMMVLSIDARGLGETRSVSDENGSDWPRYFGDYESAMTALLTGKPLVAMRAEDVSRAVDYLAARPEVDQDRIAAIGREAGAVPVLYAAVFDPRIRRVALEQGLVSYESVVRAGIHRQIFENIVQGALRRYDLPDLARWLAPREVRIVDAADPLGKPVPLAETSRVYSGSHLHVARRKPADTAATLYRDLF